MVKTRTIQISQSISFVVWGLSIFIATIFENKTAMLIVGLGGFIITAALSGWLQSRTCLNCKKRIFVKPGYRANFSKKCIHCGSYFSNLENAFYDSNSKIENDN